jgi:hypothetical protein
MPSGEILNYQSIKISPAGMPDKQSMFLSCTEWKNKKMA